MKLTRQELVVLKLMVAAKQEERAESLGVNLADLYGKLNMMWQEAKQNENS